MREIKFRAWDKTGECMCPLVSDLFWSEGGLRAYGPGYHFSQEIVDGDNIVLMQYTGLKDKNGKEIYEGDVIEIWHEETFFEGEVVGEVEWSESDACFEIMFPTRGVSFAILGIDMYYANPQVVGNIYENPELLEEPK